MTYPITPNPAIHQQPKAIGQQKALLTGQQLLTFAEVLPLAMTQALVDAILTALGAPQSAITVANESLAALASTILEWLSPTAANAQTAFQNWETLFEAVGIPASTAAQFASWLSGVNQTASMAHSTAATALIVAGQSTNSWTTLLAQLEQGNVSALSSWLTTAFTNAETAFNQWISVLEAQGLEDIEAFITFINGLVSNPTWNALLTALFGAPAVSNLTVIENDIINFLSNAITGGSAPTSGTSSQPSPAATLLDAFTAIPHSNVVIPPSPGSGSITHDVTNHATPYAGTVNNYVSLTWNHNCATTSNYLIMRVLFYATSSTVVTASYNSVTMQLLQSIQDGNITTQIYGLVNPTTGTNQASLIVYAPFGNYISIVAAESDSYIGVGSVGTTTTNTGLNSNPSITVPSATGDYIVQAFGCSMATSSATLGTYQTLQYNSGSIALGASTLVLTAADAAGASSVTFTSTASYTAANYWATAAVNLIPLPASTLGSGFRAANTSTSNVSVPTATTNALFPNSFFNSTTGQPIGADFVASGYSTTGNTVTVGHAGWYTATIATLISATVSNQYLGLLLYQTPSGGSASIKRGNHQYIYNPLASANYVVSHTFQVYCNANDTLQPGYYASTTGNFFAGTADGLSTYFEVGLMNRSLM